MKVTLHVLAVGRSFLDSVKSHHPELEGTLASGQLPSGVDTVAQALVAATDESSRLRESLFTDEQRAAVLGADAADAAEWSSLAAVHANPKFSRPADAEGFVYIASDTEDGLRAAALLSLRHGRPVHYIAEPMAAAGDLRIEPEQCYVCRIPDLDLGGRTPTTTTWRSLGAVGKLVADAATQRADHDWRVVLHFSGGYKAMVPYLLAMGEGVKSRLRALVRPGSTYRPEITAIAAHKPSSGAPIVVPLPLRALEGDSFKDAGELRKATAPDQERVLHTAVDRWMLGQFFEEDGPHHYRLTSTGLILVSVL